MKNRVLAVDTLTPTQERAILALVAQPTIARAAQRTDWVIANSAEKKVELAASNVRTKLLRSL